MSRLPAVAACLLAALACTEKPPTQHPGQHAGCVPLTCEGQGFNCGLHSDGCGLWMECGECEAPEVCGGKGIAGVCACPPDICPCVGESDAELCQARGKNCGTIDVYDSCITMRRPNCGTCTPPETCGGGGEPNVCGCAGETDFELCAFQGAHCGELVAVDSCQRVRTVQCGSCPAPEVCGDSLNPNRCLCPETDAELCQRLGAECGTLESEDVCGARRRVACGACPGGKVCGATGLPNACGAPLCSDGGLCWSQPLPQGNPIRDIWASSASDAWAAGDSGALLHWDGTGWRAYPAGEHDWLGVWGSAPDDVWVVGALGARAHWDGSAWTQVPADSRFRLTSVSGSARDDVWVVGYGPSPEGSGMRAVMLHFDGAVWTTFDGPDRAELQRVFSLGKDKVWAVGDASAVLRYDGSAWSTVGVPASGVSLRGVWAFSENDLYLAGGFAPGMVLRFDGSNWSEMEGPFLNAGIGRIAGRSASDLYVSGDRGFAVHWDGLRWTPLDSATTQAFRGLWVSEGAVFLGGDQGALLLVQDEAVRASPLPRPTRLKSIWSPGYETAWAVGDRGTILFFDRETWVSIESPTAEDLEAIWGPPGSSRPFAVGAHGTLLRADGLLWVPAGPVVTRERLRGVGGTGETEAWAVGDNGTLLLWDGSSWSHLESPTTEDLYAVWALPGGSQAWAVGASGTRIHFTGQKWVRDADSLTEVTLRAVWARAENAVWAVGDAGTVLHWDGQAWRREEGIPTTVDLHAVGGATDSEVWVAGDLGTLLRWNGSTWSLDVLPVPERIHAVWGRQSDSDWFWLAGQHGTLWYWDGTKPAHLQYQLAVELDSSYLRSVLSLGSTTWVVDSAGGIRRWTPQGWQRVFSPSVNSLRGISGSAENDIWAVGEQAPVHWDGVRWKLWPLPVQATLNAVWAGDGTNVWAVGASSKIFRWGERGWEQPYENPSGQPLNAVWGSAPNDVWAVGDKGAVVRWKEGGWDLVVPAYSLTSERLHAVWGLGTSDVWAAGGWGTLLHFDGEEWKAVPSPTENTLYGLCGAENTLWAVGAEGTVLRRSGGEWTPIPSGTAIRLVACSVDANGVLRVVGDGNVILQYAP